MQSSVFHMMGRLGPVICNPLSLLLAQIVRQEYAWTREGERGEGRLAEAVPHCTSGGGQSGWVECLYSSSVSFMWAAWLVFFFFLNIPGGTFYDPQKADYSDFKAWLQCYSVDGMKCVRDHNGRTIWFKVSFFRDFLFFEGVYVSSPFYTLLSRF